jgi:hypothetical protein
VPYAFEKAKSYNVLCARTGGLIRIPQPKDSQQDLAKYGCHFEEQAITQRREEECSCHLLWSWRAFVVLVGAVVKGELGHPRDRASGLPPPMQAMPFYSSTNRTRKTDMKHCTKYHKQSKILPSAGMLHIGGQERDRFHATIIGSKNSLPEDILFRSSDRHSDKLGYNRGTLFVLFRNSLL